MEYRRNRRVAKMVVNEPKEVVNEPKEVVNEPKEERNIGVIGE